MECNVSCGLICLKNIVISIINMSMVMVFLMGWFRLLGLSLLVVLVMRLMFRLMSSSIIIIVLVILIIVCM